LEKDTKIGLPRQDSNVTDEEVESGELEEPVQERALRIESVEVSGRIVRSSFYYGRFSDHPKALGRPGRTADIELIDRAPSRLFNFVLALPDEGTTGIVAMEDISRSCPVSPIVRWLTWQSQKDSAAANKATDDPAKKKSWWRLTLTPLADGEQLDRMIERGDLEKLELVKLDAGGDRTRRQEFFRVTAPSLDENIARRAGQVMKSWFGRGVDAGDASSTHNPTNAEGARQLAAVLSRELIELDFDDGWVVLRDEGDRPKRISPTRLAEFFVYPISRDNKPPSLEFYDHVRSKALSLQDAVRIDIDWVPFLT
jgi:hypothetical protein